MGFWRFIFSYFTKLKNSGFVKRLILHGTEILYCKAKRIYILKLNFLIESWSGTIDKILTLSVASSIAATHSLAFISSSWHDSDFSSLINDLIPWKNKQEIKIWLSHTLQKSKYLIFFDLFYHRQYYYYSGYTSKIKQQTFCSKSRRLMECK